VAVGLSPSDPGSLAGYVASEYVPGSPNYRAYLDPSVLAQRFGPSSATVTGAREYFSGFGLTTQVASNGYLLLVSGASSEMARAFGTSFDEYRAASGRLFVSHPTAALLPGTIPWTGAFGLGNVTPIEPAARSGEGRGAFVGPAASCVPGPAGLSPCQIRSAYDYNALVGNGTNGSGESVGIVDAYDSAEPQSQLAHDLASFDSEFVLPGGGVRYAYPVNTTANINRSGANSAWGLEEALDVEWVHASAPGAEVVMTFSPDAGPGLFAAIDWLVSTASVDAISLSWGEPLTGEYNAYAQPCLVVCNASSDGTYAILEPIFEAAAAEGISVFAAAGDCGAADGTSGVAVNYPAADPFVTGVGGTVLGVQPNGTYLGETAWSGNDTGAFSPGCQNQGGSGGGYAPLPRPAWQLGLPANPPGRGVPDVALDAGTAASVVFGNGDVGVAGTSLATPLWAGISAIADESAGRSLGFLNPSLYRIYVGTNYSADFRDIILGGNGYSAHTGWDPVTGLGTPIVANLVRDLSAPSVSLTSEPRSFLFASPRYGPAPLTVSFALNASGGTGSYPLEGADFGDGNSTIAGGAATHTYLTPGVYSAQAFVVDSGGYASLSPPLAIVVGGGHSLGISIATSNRTPLVGSSVLFTVNATGGDAPYRFDVAFGDGTYLVNASGPSVTHTYRTAGSFCAEVVARDSALVPDGVASQRVGLAVGDAPAPYCGNASNPLSLAPAPGLSVRDAPADFPSLFVSSGGTPAPPGLSNSLEYRAGSSYVNACHCTLFPDPGTYTVEAWENDTAGGEAFAQTNVTVLPPLTATFDASTTSGTAPLAVSFTASASGGDRANASTTVWSFGDGTGAVGASTNKVFSAPGEYLAIARLSDAGFGNASEAFLVDVLPAGGPTSAGVTATMEPVVDLSSGTTVHFRGAVVAPTSDGPLNLEWDLGGDAAAFGTSANETYFAPLSNGSGNALGISLALLRPNLTVAATLNVSLPSFFAVESEGFVPEASALTLTTTLGPTLGFSPFSIEGAASAVGPGGATVVWDFGDGTTAGGSPVRHTYARNGTYTAEAMAQDPYLDTAVASYAISVDAPLGLSGGPSITSGVAPVSVTFTANASGGNGPPYRYVWSIGDGPAVNGSTVVESFSTPGVYLATVTVTDRGGNIAERDWNVTVRAPPSSGLPGPELVALAGAVGIGGAVLALWVGRRGGARPPPSPPPTL
jgi:PKD repeat protein